ncbi:MAG: rhomboid family intramembrane serine protease [Bacteroidota bacterium]
MSNYYRPSMFGGFSFFPPVIKGLIITNAAVFVLLYFFGAFRMDGMSLAWVFNTYLGLMPLFNGFYPWQLITYQFMHADFWHLFFNMVFGLWMFGMEVEHIWGSRKFLIFYLSCGVVAGLSQLILAPILEPSTTMSVLGQAIPTVGASGAVYGVLIAFGMMFPDRYIYIYFLIPVKVKYFVMFLIVLGVMSIGGPGNVANLAHLGGALGGYLYLLYDMKRMPFRSAIDRGRHWWNARSVQGRASDDTVVEAKVFDIHDGKEHHTDEGSDIQKRIDEILDKISRSGYQSLTEEEKKLLFEASKKLN